MSEQLRESLSAAMDDEADAFELRRVLDEAQQDDVLQEQWHRFHLVRDVIKDQTGAYQPGLRASLFEALRSEGATAQQDDPLLIATENDAKHGGRSPWLGRVAGTAVAVVVAAVVMINGGVFEEDAQSVDYAGAAPTNTAPAPIPVMYPQATRDDMQRQNGLILHHIQQRAMNQRGLTSFVKVATFRGTPKLRPATQITQPEADPRP